MAHAAVPFESGAEPVPGPPRTVDAAGAETRQRLAAMVKERRAEAAAARFQPAYVVRLQEIRRLTDVNRARLERAYAELQVRLGDDRDAFGTAWHSIAAGWSFARVNRLIDEHNARYPVERSLPYDPSTRDYAGLGGRPYRRAQLDAAWVLDHFPPPLPSV